MDQLKSQHKSKGYKIKTWKKKKKGETIIFELALFKVNFKNIYKKKNCKKKSIFLMRVNNDGQCYLNFISRIFW